MNVIETPTEDIIHKKSIKFAGKVARKAILVGSPNLKLKSFKLTDTQYNELVHMVSTICADTVDRMLRDHLKDYH